MEGYTYVVSVPKMVVSSVPSRIAHWMSRLKNEFISVLDVHELSLMTLPMMVMDADGRCPTEHPC